MRFILGSSSPRRKELLRELIDDFEVAKPDVDEAQLAGEDALDHVLRLSKAKASAVAHQQPAAPAGAPFVVLAADTVIIRPGSSGARTSLGKPDTPAEARETLVLLRGTPHTVATGFTLLSSDGRCVSRLVETKVCMRQYTDGEMDRYIATGDPFDKAGSYAIQDEVFRPAETVDGSYSNVVGLPLEVLRDELRAFGVPVKAA
ncbi:hypothetical protein DIPPA_24379 [Diplonema papillatum]|nr:hypothetical protein DIPPA_24379 [Diplonema papillatum]